MFLSSLEAKLINREVVRIILQLTQVISATVSVIRKVELNQLIEQDLSSMVFLASLKGSRLFHSLTNSNLPIIPSLMGRQSHGSGYASILQHLTWREKTMTLKLSSCQWHSSLCHSSGLTGSALAQSTARKSSSGCLLKTFLGSSHVQVLGMNSETASNSLMSPSGNITGVLQKSVQQSDVSDYDVIEFSNGIRERWQYQDSCRRWPQNMDQFRRHVQNMID